MIVDFFFFLSPAIFHHKSAAKANRKGIPDKRCGGVLVLIDARDINETFTLKKIKNKKYYSKKSTILTVWLERMERREAQLPKARSQLFYRKRCFSPLHTCTLAKKRHDASVNLNYCCGRSEYDSWSSHPGRDSQPV